MRLHFSFIQALSQSFSAKTFESFKSFSHHILCGSSVYPPWRSAQLGKDNQSHSE